MPGAIFNVYSPQEQWSRFWKGKSLEEEVKLCGFRELRVHLARVLRDMEDPLVVEAGCGIGAWVAYLSKCGVHRVVGVDNYVEALLELKRYEPNSSVVAADVRNLPFKNDSVDVCISLGVVEHFDGGPGPLILEMFRVLRSGGIMVLTVPYYNLFRRIIIHPFRTLYLNLQSRIRRRELHFVEYRFKRSELEYIITACGFELEQIATDDYELAELSLGLYTDIPLFRGKEANSLNIFGRLVRRLTLRINPWLTTGGILLIAKKPGNQASKAEFHRADEKDLEDQELLSVHR